MIKQLLVLVLLTITTYAVCTASQEQEAMRLWKSSIHQEDTQKLQTLHKAERICPLIPIIKVDIKIIEAENDLNKNALREVKNLNNTLIVSLDQRVHKWNNNRKIDALWIRFYEAQKSKKSLMIKDIDNSIKLLKNRAALPSDNTKAIRDIGGYYKADLLFDKNRATIKNKALVQEIISVMQSEIKSNPDALFALAGGASSEGNANYNLKLSKKRAVALQKSILKAYPNYQENVTVFAKGESQLVCEGGLLPESNSANEYGCETKENKKASRRVTIRRVR